MHSPDPEKGGILSEHHNDSSVSSDSSSRSSSTDPSSITSEDNGLPRILHAPHSATPPRRANGRPTHRVPSRRLGAIDEHSPSIAPDIPTRNPNRPKKMVSFLPADASKFFSFSSYARPEADIPPPNAYDKIVGPRGEKFKDVRQNRPDDQPGRRRRSRKMLCLGLIIFAVILAIALGVGLGVGLTRNKGTRYLFPPFMQLTPTRESLDICDREVKSRISVRQLHLLTKKCQEALSERTLIF